jgi:hypothetical protein
MNTTQLIAQLESDDVAGGRIYPGRAVENPALPYAIYDKYSGPVSTGTEGDTGRRVRYDFTCWCSSWSEADALVESFRDSLQDVGRAEGVAFIRPDEENDEQWQIINLSFVVIE